ncbi:MAG: GDCCVxC domain-containing (seleno)protein [Chloroflexota bacterium]
MLRPFHVSRRTRVWSGRLTTIIRLESIITCPSCGFAKQKIMPTDSCQFLYRCTHCQVILRPKPGDCCVFCSYGSVPCPPKQIEGESGSCSCNPA